MSISMMCCSEARCGRTASRTWTSCCMRARTSRLFMFGCCCAGTLANCWWGRACGLGAMLGAAIAGSMAAPRGIPRRADLVSRQSRWSRLVSASILAATPPSADKARQAATNKLGHGAGRVARCPSRRDTEGHRSSTSMEGPVCYRCVHDVSSPLSCRPPPSRSSASASSLSSLRIQHSRPRPRLSSERRSLDPIPRPPNALPLLCRLPRTGHPLRAPPSSLPLI